MKMIVISIFYILFFSNSIFATFLDDTYAQIYLKQNFDGTYFGLSYSSRAAENTVLKAWYEIPLRTETTASNADKSRFFVGIDQMVDQIILEYKMIFYKVGDKIEQKTRLGVEI